MDLQEFQYTLTVPITIEQKQCLVYLSRQSRNTVYIYTLKGSVGHGRGEHSCKESQGATPTASRMKRQHVHGQKCS